MKALSSEYEKIPGPNGPGSAVTILFCKCGCPPIGGQLFLCRLAGERGRLQNGKWGFFALFFLCFSDVARTFRVPCGYLRGTLVVCLYP